MRSEMFSQRTGNDLFLKLDNMNVTGSFKERGALNRLLLLTAEERARGVITASAGNHAQAVAYHARGSASRRDLHAHVHAAGEGDGNTILGRDGDPLWQQL